MKTVTLAVLISTAVSLQAQSVISARAGMIHFAEGQVFIGEQTVENKFGVFPEVKKTQVLRTAEGRAEVLLTPGVFLRNWENTSIRMLDTSLDNAKLEFLAGSAMVEADDILKDNSVTIVVKDATIHLQKNGLYRVDSDPMRLRVYQGEASVTANGQTLEVKAGKMVTFDGQLAVTRFDAKESDELARWSRRRGEYIAMANPSSARSLETSGFYGNQSSWRWNPYFGMYTFIPGSGRYTSPYGYSFWSPYEVYRIYAPRPSYSGYDNSGWSAASSGFSGYSTSSGSSAAMSSASSSSSGSYSAPTSSSGGASSAPVSHSGGSAGGSHK